MDDFNLSDFIDKTEADELIGEWRVEIPLSNGTKGALFVKDAANEYEAKERAYIYLIHLINNESNSV